MTGGINGSTDFALVERQKKPKSQLSEAQIESRFVKLANERGAMCIKFTSPGLPGVPDRIVITADGRTIYVELKTVAGKLAGIQQWVIQEMRKRSADVRVLRGLDAVKEFVKEL